MIKLHQKISAQWLSPHRPLSSAGYRRPHAKLNAGGKVEDPPISLVEEPPSTSAASIPLPDEKYVQSGTLDLILVSFLWGTYNPVMKLIYADDQNMDPSTLTAIRTVLSALALGVAVVIEQSGKKGAKDQGDSEPDLLTSTTEDRVEGILTWTSSSVMIAGIELGIYNFLGTSLQAQGIQLTSATRAGFLSQLAAVLTPALSVLIGEKISMKVWLAIALGLLGSCLVAFDAVDGSSAAALSELSPNDSEELKGAAFLLSACLFYSLATVRLGLVAQKFSSVNLAAWKKLTLGVTSVLWFLTTPHQGSGFNDWLDHRSLFSIALILYSSLGSGALGTFLQTRGQRSVSATRAQVLYGLVPIWSAAAAYLVFGDSEGTGAGTWVGGSLVLVAGILASQKKERS